MKTAMFLLMVGAATSTLLAENSIPVSALLNPDGSLELDHAPNGTIDAGGFTMRLDPDRGLLFTESLVTPQWNDLQLSPWGYTADVYAIALYNGSIYAGGFFYDGAGNPAIDYLGRWDGCVWHPVAGGLNDAVYALTVANGLLYIGGLFTDAGGNANADCIATWNGTSFSNVGPGLNNAVTSLTHSDYGVVAGGFFTNAGNNADADGIAAWTGSAWTAMGTGLSGWIWTLASQGTNLYAGGEITNGIMRWNGSEWSAPGGGLNGDVYDIKIYGSDVYAGGGFTNAGGNPLAHAIARWDGNTWHNVGNYFDTDMSVTALCIDENKVYVSGFSYNGCWMAVWDMVEQSWDGGMGLPAAWWVEHLEWLNDELFMGSANTFGGGGYQSGIYRWGEPSGIEEIMGVPYFICQLEAPISLPTTQSGYTGNWSGPGVSNNVFNPAGQTGYVTLTFTPDPGQCAMVTNFIIEVYLIYYTPNAPAVICENADPIALSNNQDGVVGNWSGTGVSNNVFDPAGLAGNITLTFTPGPGQCALPETDIIYVETPVLPSISGVPAVICEDDEPIDLPQNQNGFLGYWSGPGVADNTFDPDGLTGFVTLVFIPFPTECALIAAYDIEVTPVIPITISGVPEELCQLDSPIPLPVSQSGIGGNWSGPGVVNNIFNPAGLSGEIDLLFIPESIACALPTVFSIDVYAYIPVISGVPGIICENHPTIELPVNQGGFIGNWSGPGVTNNTFNPFGHAGTVLLQFQPSPAQCALPVFHTILVNEPVDPVLIGIPEQLCEQSPVIELPEVVNGIPGTWSGQGVLGYQFDPEGLHGFVTLMFLPDPGECAVPVPVDIEVFAAVAPVISGVSTLICENASPQFLPVIQSGIPGNWSGPGVDNNVLYPAGLEQDITLTFTPVETVCAMATTWQIALSDTVIPMLAGFPLRICDTDSALPLSATQSGFTGNWSGPGISNNIFTPIDLQGNITWMFTPDDTGCAVPAFTEITIDTHIVPDLSGIPAALCADENAIGLPISQAGVTGYWEGPGISNDTFFPADLSGQALLSFIINHGACEDTARTTIAVLHSPQAGVPVVRCDSTSNTYTVSFTLNGGDSTTYYVDGNPLSGSTFNSTPLLFTQSAFSFEISDANGCNPTIVSGVNPCACTSSAGTITGNATEPLRICHRGLFSLLHQGDYFLDPDDMLMYVLHNGTATALGDILVTSGNGIFNPPSILLEDRVYYITVLAGNTNESGEVDLHDPCLSIANGIPVVFVYCEPEETPQEPVDAPGNLYPFQGGNVFFNLASSPGHRLQNQQILSVRMYTSSGLLVFEGKDLPETPSSMAIPGCYILHRVCYDKHGKQQVHVSKMILIDSQ